jgi:16S rRNA (cytosine1402-N4)-methyltransferase
MEDQDPEKRPRRVRYKGTHPKAFKEKYKELDPALYGDDVAKVMEQGRTPAGMHRSICVNEILEFLQISPGQKGLDATLGYGGHSAEMLKKLLPNGHLFAIDVDPFELPKTKERLAAMGFGGRCAHREKNEFFVH